jgi:N-methylhydantoinase B
MGARPYRDGMDAVRVHASGAANLPVEALEHAYPLRMERYALRDGSGGYGAYRGGAGVIRDYRALASGIQVSLSSERQHVAAPGLAGGEDGVVGEFVLDPGGPGERVLRSAEADIAVPEGTILSIRTPGGGAYGHPADRDPDARARDLAEGRIGARESQEQAPAAS